MEYTNDQLTGINMNLLEWQVGWVIRFQHVNSIEMCSFITSDPAGTWMSI